MPVETRVVTWGSSLAVRIPKPIAEQWGVQDGSAIEIIPKGDTLLLRKRTYDLADLLEQVTLDNLHGEIDVGDAQSESDHRPVQTDRYMEGSSVRQRQGSKYEAALELKWTCARKPWKCYACGREINPGDHYYRQSLGLINKPPRVCLNAFCSKCADSPLTKKLTQNPRRHEGGQAPTQKGPQLFTEAL